MVKIIILKLSVCWAVNINRGVGYGLEVQFMYRFYSSKVYVEKMNELVNSLD